MTTQGHLDDGGRAADWAGGSAPSGAGTPADGTGGDDGSQVGARRWTGRPQRLIAALAVLVLVSGLLGAAVVAFLAFHSAGDRLTARTPNDTDLYATVLLDPSVSQKLHISALAHKFPRAGSGDPSKQVDSTMQDALKGSGLSYRDDIKPWLGHQIAIAGRTGGSLDAPPALAILVDAGDEARATTALGKYRASSSGRDFDWSQSSYRGVTIWSGHRRTAAASTSATSTVSVYAVLDHMAVIGDDQPYLRDIIDTAQGRHGNLAASGGYRQVMGRLPTDYVVSGYANPKPILGTLKERLRGQGGPGFDPTRSLDAYRSAGMTLAATDAGLSAELDVEVDRSKLDAAGRSALDQPPHVNATLGSVPANAYGFLGLGGVKQSLQELVQQYSSDPQTRDLIQQLGLNGPGGFIAHLNGDVGVEVAPGPGSTQAGALLIGVDDSGVAQDFLDRVAQLIQAGPSATGPSTVSGGQPLGNLSPGPAATAADPGVPGSTAPPAGLLSEDYRGVTMTHLDTGPGGSVAPAYAVVDRVAVVGSSTEAVRAVIDAAKGGKSLAHEPRYTTALAGQTTNNGEAFIDIAAVAGAIRSSLSGQAAVDFDRDAAPNLRPLRSLVYTTVGHSDHITTRISVQMR